ncbi:MAG: hypothetical protein NDJ18_01145 [candidate division Zixibacteria bacterium]|nr:hypothetical protein [candidate division Zixibacteria bacterium]
MDDFFLLDLTVQNIGIASLRQLFIGLYVDGDVWYSPGSFGMPQDDLCGFLPTFSSSKKCGFVDTVGLAWIADNDGDPYEGQWVSRGGVRPCRGIMGFRFLRVPTDSKLSFNWWAGNMDPRYDFGPRARPSEGHPFRDFRTGGTGTPEGDGNKYHMLSNGEFDYDQAFVAKISMVDQHWLYPNEQVANLIKTGGDVRYLLSLGPFELLPGETVPLAFAYVLGENFHNDPDIRQYLESNQPEEWYKRVDFSNLVTNAKWAQWVYDNPGVDTDSDGYFGEYRVCVLDSQFIDGSWVPLSADTTWYKGDGVPDWRAVQPPPAPTFWLEPQLNGIRVRFNGQRSETTKDIFSGIIDFEGYRIYLGRDEREASLALAASYDKENYDIFVWNPLLHGTGEYELQQIPAMIDELRCRFGQGEDPCDDSLFDPLAYTRSNPWRSRFFVDSLFYFVPHENNSSRFGITTPIRRVYPEAVPPGPTDTVTADDLTPDGYLKCYEYECFIENLLPTVSYYLNVTAFDFGSPEADLEALETSKLLGVQSAYPYADRDQSDSTLPPVYIYPNPYRYDAHYRDGGYEGRASNRIDDRERRIHFVNVPPRCTIRIHTLDGDLVRELRHDDDPSDPNAYRATWDLINRNAQPIVSGLYYWSVESTDGLVQMGKLVVIQ